jgi:hypothetical protein
VAEGVADVEGFLRHEASEGVVDDGALAEDGFAGGGTAGACDDGVNGAEESGHVVGVGEGEDFFVGCGEGVEVGDEVGVVSAEEKELEGVWIGGEGLEDFEMVVGTVAGGGDEEGGAMGIEAEGLEECGAEGEGRLIETWVEEEAA